MFQVQEHRARVLKWDELSVFKEWQEAEVAEGAVGAEDG